MRLSVSGLSGSAASIKQLRDSKILLVAASIAFIGLSGAFQALPLPAGVGAAVVYGSLILALNFCLIHLVIRNGKPVARKTLLPLTLFLALPAASIVWASQRAEAVTAVAVLLVVALVGSYIAHGTPRKALIITISRTAFLLTVASLAVYFLVPSIGADVDYRGAAVRGLFPNKNSFGRVVLIGLATNMILFSLTPRPRRFIYFTSVIYVVVLLQSGSQTALAAALIGFSVALLGSTTKLAHRAPKLLAALTVAIYATASLAISTSAAAFASYLSRDATLTGRTFLWEKLEVIAREKPLTGWGQAAIWNDQSHLGDSVSFGLSFMPSSAHNGLLDVRLQTGWLGVVLTLVALYILFGRSLVNSGTEMTPALCGFAAAILASDTTESTLYSSLAWFTLWLVLSTAHNEFENK